MIDAIQRHADDGLELLGDARLVASNQDYELWSARFEWWCSATRAALASIYTDSGAAEQFDHAVGDVYRHTWQDDAETFENQRRAIEQGVHTLDRLREQLAGQGSERGRAR